MRFFVTCERGTEGPLRRELVSLGIRAPKGEHAGVSFEGTLTLAMKVCLHARTAMRVLLQLAEFEAPTAEALYEGVRAIAWTDHLTAETTLAVRAAVRDTPTITHSGFAALKVKDAIVDAVRDRTGKRPNVAPDDPDVQVMLQLAAGHARVAIDLAGEPLHRRGYRVAMTEAPLKETLAASILALGGVPTDAPFVDPMAGSGTLAIEHALRARAIAPGLLRTTRFGFERWPHQSLRASFRALKDEARAAVLPGCPAPIVARDLDPSAADAIRKNALAAGVDKDIRVEQGDVRALAPAFDRGTLVSNPPYGERLGSDRATTRLYRDLARVVHTLWGWQIVLVAGTPALPDAIGIPPAISHRLWNGGLEVRLLRYDLGASAPR